MSGKCAVRHVAGRLPPDDGVGAQAAQSVPGFSTRLPARNAGLDVLRRDLHRPGPVSRTCSPTRSRWPRPTAAGPAPPDRPTPCRWGCKQLAVLRPPLVGHGWSAFNGCCAVAAYHRDAILPVNGLPQAGEQFAIDFNQIGPDNTCCRGPPELPSSWWSYGAPVLAARRRGRLGGGRYPGPTARGHDHEQLPPGERARQRHRRGHRRRALRGLRALRARLDSGLGAPGCAPARRRPDRPRRQLRQQ